MKKVTALILAIALMCSTGCSSMSRSEKIAVGATVAIAAAAAIIIFSSKKKKQKCYKPKRRCDCHIPCH